MLFRSHEIIKNVAASFEGICTQKKISFELIFATKHLEVIADKRKIQQVLYNLLDNAIKFSDSESDITIETTNRGDKVYISVKDYGIGIPRNALNKIWERFYKTDLSRGKDKKGTGLGLAIVKEAIQAHGENINVVSTEGVGNIVRHRFSENNTSFRRRKTTKRTTQENTSRINSRHSHTIASFSVKRNAEIIITMESKPKKAVPAAQTRLTESLLPFTFSSLQSTYNPCHRPS